MFASCFMLVSRENLDDALGLEADVGDRVMFGSCSMFVYASML